MFFWKCQSFRDRKCLCLRGTSTPNLHIHAKYVDNNKFIHWVVSCSMESQFCLLYDFHLLYTYESQWTGDVIMMSLFYTNNIVTSCWYNNDIIITFTLKWKCCHVDKIFATGCIGSFENDNFWCSQWQNFVEVTIFLFRCTWDGVWDIFFAPKLHKSFIFFFLHIGCCPTDALKINMVSSGFMIQYTIFPPQDLPVVYC